MTTDTQLTPTDAEIDALNDQFRWDTTEGRRGLVREVLARWGQPARSGEPYGCVTTHRGTGQQFFYRYPEPPYLDNASECVTVYTAPQPVEREHLTDEMVLAALRVMSPATFKHGLHPLEKDGPMIRQRMEIETKLVRKMLDAAHGIKGGQHGADT